MPSERPFSATPAVTLADFTGPGLIIPQLRGGEAASVIKELAEALQLGNRIPDALPFYQAAIHREFLAGTDTEAGLAFPHARMTGLKEVSFAVGRSDVPLRWGSAAVASVRLVFLLAVPVAAATQYLQVVSGLARLSKDARMMSRLFEAGEASQMLEVLRWVGLGSHARVPDGIGGSVKSESREKGDPPFSS